MANNFLVINVDIREIRVALIEDGIIAELHIERESSKGSLGNIYVGKVSRVLPGMQAAFIDIGLERAAFLHVEDLIRPDDFEAYMQGSRRGDDRTGGANDVSDDIPPQIEAVSEVGGTPDAQPSEPSVSEIADDDLETLSAEESEEGSDDADDADGDAPIEVDEPDDIPSVPSISLSDADLDASPSGLSIPPPGPSSSSWDETDEAKDEVELDMSWEESPAEGGEATVEGVSDDAAAPVAVFADGEAPAEGAEPATDAGRLQSRGRRRRRGRGRRTTTGTADETRAKRPEGTEGRGREAARKRADPLRISRTTPIREVVREGQEVIVQVSKEAIGTKGARVTSHISLPGRHVVYLPTVEHVGISKRIGGDRERSRLREAIDGMKPPTGGLIVRTVAEGLTKKQLKADVAYLVRLWEDVVKKREGARAPNCIYSELDLVLKTARDLFTDDIQKVVIDSREEFVRLRRFVELFMPERVGAIELYEGAEPIFDAYGIEDEIGRALARKVPLPSGGYLIIDQAEALTAIDINTGRFVGKGSKDLEETILKTNLEAVEEIAYQLRFRNIGGLIILDLIDMERHGNREKVRKRLEQVLAKDKAKTTLNRISDLGLIEMTRKRTRESLGRQIHEPCFYCDGTGQLQSKESVAYEILRQIRREKANLSGYTILVNAHPAVVDLLKNEEKKAVIEAEKLFQRRIELAPQREYHLEQFDLIGK